MELVDASELRNEIVVNITHLGSTLKWDAGGVIRPMRWRDIACFYFARSGIGRMASELRVEINVNSYTNRGSSNEPPLDRQFQNLGEYI